MLEVIEKGSATESHHAPLLFVHGASVAAWCWDEHFLDFFADNGYRAVALSLRGHGASTLSQPLNSCSLADYADDVKAVVEELDSPPVLIGHSLGCWVVLNYLVAHDAPAGILMAPGTPQGLRRWALRSIRRHPWTFLRSATVGSPEDVFKTPMLAREFCFTASTPDAVVDSCAARLEAESSGVTRELMRPLPDAALVKAPIFVVGAQNDGMRVDGDALAVAQHYQTDVEMFPDMGHVMMLEPGWQEVAERIVAWLTGRGL